MTQLVWFRNDLRVSDHEALFQALNRAKQQQTPVRALFFWSDAQWRSHGAGDAKIAATFSALQALHQKLAKLGIPLDVLSVSWWTECAEQMVNYCQSHQITAIHYHTEPGWNELRRDDRVAQQLSKSVELHRYHDLYFIDPAHHLTQQGQVYKVFTAYKKSLLRQFSIDHLATFPPRKAGPALKVSPLAMKDLPNWQNPLQLPVTEDQALTRLDAFCEEVRDYADRRDFPADNGTSQLSAALALGCTSSRQVAHTLHRHHISLASDTFFSEIIWRDFYKYLLFHTPRLCLGEPYNEKWDAFPWQKNETWLERWREGKTGVPIVDAAMRQLRETGWMHNRLRMVTGMYLVKILQQDWRQGEAWFAEHLADFDFAANNGGWQWVASTGVDAVPYFRIFNPYQQSKRFDPNGQFILTFVTELNDVKPALLHDHKRALSVSSYPKPLTDYSKARQDTLDKFKALGSHAAT
ncbi:cryptochrome/photolyase family protein [Reinekea blandensis]|uniref:Putative deoxyribodipyrimidine photolyase n=1 Tax=Reinekea blandensis MED297 TaxID=314283 RepID=A4BJR5_9GAMM|nr:FAD-binding domain-containing protein [Reinekea blandensis]EAR07640.1 putative deoxyribodipyrimidine photolyase [Reinekea sp. MED297] [Reinekea blandensis MED297]